MITQKQIEQVIIESDLWDAFVAGMATIYERPRKDAEKHMNAEFYQDIAAKIITLMEEE